MARVIRRAAEQSGPGWDSLRAKREEEEEEDEEEEEPGERGIRDLAVRGRAIEVRPGGTAARHRSRVSVDAAQMVIRPALA
ncbi:MAG: hypothetical protein R3F21_13430 [Myxococcota bacterium]